jgi:hypothetical protein
VRPLLGELRGLHAVIRLGLGRTVAESRVNRPSRQVENQVGLVRKRFFAPRLRVQSYEELNTLLLDRCVACARVHRHPELSDRMVWEMFEAERASRIPCRCRVDGFHAVPASVSRTSLVRFDNNKASVAARAVGRPAEIRADADRIELRQDDGVVRTHRRCFGQAQMRFDPWHYGPLLARKPGAPCRGAPFKDWLLAGALGRARPKLAVVANVDCQMVESLTAALSDGLAALFYQPPGPLTLF